MSVYLCMYGIPAADVAGRARVAAPKRQRHISVRSGRVGERRAAASVRRDRCERDPDCHKVVRVERRHREVRVPVGLTVALRRGGGEDADTYR